MPTHVQVPPSPQSSFASSPVAQHRPRPPSKHRFTADLSQCLINFVFQLLPTPQEKVVKEDVRKLLERLIRTIEPESRLLSFGSTANGFSLRNSDMDLCCLMDSDKRRSASDLVTALGCLLERETKFHVKPLPHARIPIVKLSLDPSPGLPLGIACDIGFENRLALENTRILMCYGMIDPTRVRTLVLFLKIWSKRRKINSPYKGTLSSYGYVLLVIYFLVHVKNPPVLPNLQQMPPLRPMSKEDMHFNGHNIWFFDDIELLRSKWQSSNVENVAELLVDFFRYFAKDFLYNTGVASVRAGLLKKESKGWQHEFSPSKIPDPSRERNRFCIEDPFEIDFNVARCVTKDGLYTIRGEFMRAARILAARPDPIFAIAHLCEERKEELVMAPMVPPRLSSVPPQTPYSVGSNFMRPSGLISPERLSPQPHFLDPGLNPGFAQVADRLPPEHMAPKRGKWTNPPPPEALPTDHSVFEDQLGLGLALATSSTEAREKELAYASSSSNSELLSDDEPRSDTAESDDVKSIRSFTEGSSPSISFRSPHWHYIQSPIRNTPSASVDISPAHIVNGNRRRAPNQYTDEAASVPLGRMEMINISHPTPNRNDLSRKSPSGPPRTVLWSSPTPIALAIPLPPSPISPLSPSNVFYETNGVEHSPSHPRNGTFSTITSRPRNKPLSAISPTKLSSLEAYKPNNDPHGAQLPDRPSHTPTPSNYFRSRPPKHAHSLSSSTITAPIPPHESKFPPLGNENSPFASKLRSSPPPLRIPMNGRLTHPVCVPPSSFVSLSGESASPTPSSTGYSTSFSASPSPSSTPSSPRTQPTIVQHAALLPPSLSPLTIGSPEGDKSHVAVPTSP